MKPSDDSALAHSISIAVESATTALAGEVLVYGNAAKQMTLFDFVQLKKKGNKTDEEVNFIKTYRGQLAKLRSDENHVALAQVPRDFFEPVQYAPQVKTRMLPHDFRDAMMTTPFPKLTLSKNQEVRLPKEQEFDEITTVELEDAEILGQITTVTMKLPYGPRTELRPNSFNSQRVPVNNGFMKSIRDTLVLAAIQDPTSKLVQDIYLFKKECTNQYENHFFGTNTNKIVYNGTVISSVFARMMKGCEVRLKVEKAKALTTISKATGPYHRIYIDMIAMTRRRVKPGLWFNTTNPFSLHARYTPDPSGDPHRAALRQIFDKRNVNYDYSDPENPFFLPTPEYQVALFTVNPGSSPGLLFPHQLNGDKGVFEQNMALAHKLLMSCAGLWSGDLPWEQFWQQNMQYTLFSAVPKAEEYEIIQKNEGAPNEEKPTRIIYSAPIAASLPFLALSNAYKKYIIKEPHFEDSVVDLGSFVKEGGKLQELFKNMMNSDNPVHVCHYSDNVYLLLRVVVSQDHPHLNNKLTYVFISLDASSFEAHHAIEDTCAAMYNFIAPLCSQKDLATVKARQMALIQLVREATKGDPYGVLQPTRPVSTQAWDELRFKQEERLNAIKKDTTQFTQKMQSVEQIINQAKPEFKQVIGSHNHLSDAYLGYFSLFVPYWLATAVAQVQNNQLKIVGMPTGIGPTFYINNEVSRFDAHHLAEWLTKFTETIMVDDDLVKAFHVYSPAAEKKMRETLSPEVFKEYLDKTPQFLRELKDGYVENLQAQKFLTHAGKSWQPPSGAVWKVTAIAGAQTDLLEDASDMAKEDHVLPLDFLGFDVQIKTFGERSYWFPILHDSRLLGMALWNKSEARHEVFVEKSIEKFKDDPTVKPDEIRLICRTIVNIIVAKTAYAYGGWLSQARAESYKTYITNQMADLMDFKVRILSSNASLSKFIKNFLLTISNDSEDAQELDLSNDEDELYDILPSIGWVSKLWLNKDDALELANHLGFKISYEPPKNAQLKKRRVVNLLEEDEKKKDPIKELPLETQEQVLPSVYRMGDKATLQLSTTVKKPKMPPKIDDRPVFPEKPRLTFFDLEKIKDKLFSDSNIYLNPRYVGTKLMELKTPTDLVMFLLNELNLTLNGLDPSDYYLLKDELRNAAIYRLTLDDSKIFYRFDPNKFAKGSIRTYYRPGTRSIKVIRAFDSEKLSDLGATPVPIKVKKLSKSLRDQEQEPTAHETAKLSGSQKQNKQNLKFKQLREKQLMAAKKLRDEIKIDPFAKIKFERLEKKESDKQFKQDLDLVIKTEVRKRAKEDQKELEAQLQPMIDSMKNKLDQLKIEYKDDASVVKEFANLQPKEQGRLKFDYDKLVAKINKNKAVTEKPVKPLLLIPRSRRQKVQENRDRKEKSQKLDRVTRSNTDRDAYITETSIADDDVQVVEIGLDEE